VKLITKELDKALEKEGKKIKYDMENGTSSKLMVVGHLFHPYSNFDWYLIGYSMLGDNKNCIYTLTKGPYLEYGDIYLPELQEVKIMGLGVERDLYFTPIGANDLHAKLSLEGAIR